MFCKRDNLSKNKSDEQMNKTYHITQNVIDDSEEVGVTTA